MRPPGSPKQLEKRRRRAIRLLQAGESVRAVARLVGSSVSSVMRWQLATGMRLAPQPNLRLSIVVAAWNGLSALQECLASLKDQGQAADTEIIVVCNFDAEAKAMLEARFPHVKFVGLPADTTVPVLRATGTSCSRGDVVALLEDHCAVDDRWSSEIKNAHALSHAIIGGSVENASPDRALNWAVCFYDYGKYMLPNQAGRVSSVSGMNASYKRAVLAEVEDSFREGFLEVFVHRELEKRGHALYLIPSAIVYHKKNYELTSVFPQFFHLARSFAAKRVSGAPLKRILFTAGSFLLPILLTVRTTWTILRKGRYFKELMISLPHLSLLMTSWSTGEFCGYLFGEGGSARRWE